MIVPVAKSNSDCAYVRACVSGKAVELVEQFGSTDAKVRENAITGHRLMIRLVTRLLYYKNSSLGWQSSSLLFRPLRPNEPGASAVATSSRHEDHGTPLLDRSSDVATAQRGYAARRYQEANQRGYDMYH